VTLPLSLPLPQGLRPALVLKCAAVGSFDTVTVTVSQPKSALALGGSIRGSFAQGREQAAHEAPQPRGNDSQAVPLGVLSITEITIGKFRAWKTGGGVCEARAKAQRELTKGEG
jgi:hypothetical protein